MSEKSFSLDQLAKMTNSKLLGDPEYRVKNVNTLDKAGKEDVSFFANARFYEEAMKKTKAGVVCVDTKTPFIEGKNYLISNDPSHTFQEIARLLLSSAKEFSSSFIGIHPTAVIHSSAKIGKDVTIGPYVVIDKGVTIGDATTITAHNCIGPSVSIGNNCYFHPGCTIREGCKIGHRVILQPGAVIGSCGFGFLQNKGKFQKLDQLGIVILEDDVEIGANTTIDRARFDATIIKQGTKIDNLVQIAHNVEMGKDCAVAAQTGIAGSAKIGNNCLFGGQVGILGHIEVGDQVMIATRGGVSKSLKNPGKYRGSPAIDIHEYNRQKVHVRKLSEYVKIIKSLLKRVEELEEKTSK